MLNGQYITMSINGALMICGFVSTVITVIWSLLCITDVLAAIIGKWDSNTVTAPFWEWTSTERQHFVAL